MASPTKKPWSFLAYIAGDNNLSDFGLIDITEMCKVGASPQVHVAVQIDTEGEHDGSVRYEITEPNWRGKSFRTVIDRLPESDTGDPAILKAFLEWGFAEYPAQRRLVVLWNHGSGFHAPPRRNIGYDDHGSSLDMPRLAGAFKKAGLGPKNRLDILGMDACLMCLLEVCHHVAPYAALVVGSQQTEPANGWPYNLVLKAMHANPAPAALGKAIVEAYIASCKAAGDENVTQSAILTDRTEAALEALSALGKALIAAKAAKSVRLARAKVQYFEYADYVDASHLATLLPRLKLGAKVDQAAASLSAALDACIVHSKALGEGVKHAKGLSIWFPADERTFHAFRGAYLRMRLGSSTHLRGWLDFLDEYFA